MGELGWERVRVLAGRPAPGAELTLDHTPLEAGLGGAVSLDKGCYIGQEARPRPRPPAAQPWEAGWATTPDVVGHVCV
jgi:folate-binding protein YgfZ